MNLKKILLPDSGNFSGKQILTLAFSALLIALVTGCPHNEYSIELKPTNGGVERTLTFYRADGSDTNGGIQYQEFSSNELAAIVRIYPAGAVTQKGQRHVVRGNFSGALPGDVGGAGSYTNLATSLGSAGFYLERFRGHDDLAGRVEKQFRAADKLTDLVLSWTQTEFGRERGFKNLRQFLNEDFRRDLKNAGLYFWVGEVSTLSNTNAPEEFIARSAQYLHERGYVKVSDVPELSLAFSGEGTNSAVPVLRLVQRLVAEKLGLAASDPPPKSLAVLADPAALERSWKNYLARTDLYREQIKEWEKQRKTEPGLKKPEPLSLVDNLLKELISQFEILGGSADHLTVKLALPHAPHHTNGKWQDGQVVWEASLDENRALPALCYATWSIPDVRFQQAHFGQVILDGEELTGYCLWQNSLNEQQASEWEKILASVQPGQGLKDKLEAFKRKIAGQPGAGSASK